MLGSARTVNAAQVMEGMDGHTDTQQQRRNCCKISELMVWPSGIASQETGVPQDTEITQREMETLGLQARSALWAECQGTRSYINAFIGACDPSSGGCSKPS